MNRFDQTSAVCEIFTYKEGFLSAMAHDLRLKATSFTIELGGEEHFIKARFDADSLKVDCAMVGETPRPDLLSSLEIKEIEGHIIKEVLETDRHKEITLASESVISEDSLYQVKGRLTVRTVTKEISFRVVRTGESFVADVRLHLPDFGIKPFQILFGAVKLKPDILIHIVVPAGEYQILGK